VQSAEGELHKHGVAKERANAQRAAQTRDRAAQNSEASGRKCATNRQNASRAAQNAHERLKTRYELSKRAICSRIARAFAPRLQMARSAGPSRLIACR